MPGYIFYIWCWVKVFNISEFSLRAANLPFLLLFILYLINSYLNLRTKIIFLTLVLISPIVCYYLNEARYPIIVFSLSGITLLALYNYDLTTKRKHLYILCLSAVLGSFFFMLFPFVFVGLLTIVLFGARKNFLEMFKKKENMPIIIFSLSIIFSLMFYYLISINRGAGGMKEVPGIGNIGFSLYEFLGLGGLGPPRSVLRNDGLRTLFAFSYILKVLLVIIPFSIIFLVAVLRWKTFKDKNLIKTLSVSLLLNFTVFVIIAYLFGFRFWERHLIFLFPFLLMIISIIVSELFGEKIIKVSFFILVIGWIVSDLNIRFNDYYKKDNYKLAVYKTITYSNKYSANIYWRGNLSGCLLRTKFPSFLKQTYFVVFT